MTSKVNTSDAVFMAMARPLLVLGVPFHWLFLEGIIVTILFIISKSFIVTLYIIIFHGIGWVLTKKDPHFMSILLRRSKCKFNLVSRKYWGGDSYAP